MLFRPVFGPELEAIYLFIAAGKEPVSKDELYQMFLPDHEPNHQVSTQNIDDALTFLASANLIARTDTYIARLAGDGISFRLSLLHQLRGLATGEFLARHELDPLYLLILEELFIKPDRLFVADVHAAANGLRRVTTAGGLSQEKIRSWKRVMAYLGLGYRVSKGFQCVYDPDLLYEMVEMWRQEGFIQTFLEEHATSYLPFHTETGSLAIAAEQSLLCLMAQGQLTLTARQDASNKPYFGTRRLRYLSRVNRRRKSSD